MKEYHTEPENSEQPLVEGLWSAEPALGRIEGDLLPFLRDNYLSGYLEMLQETYPDRPYLNEIPEVIDAVLAPICEPGSWGVNGWHVELISSAARYMASGPNPRHWGAKRFFVDQMEQLGIPGFGTAIQHGDSETDIDAIRMKDLYHMFSGEVGLAADPDIDPLVPSASEAFRRLRERFGADNRDTTQGAGSAGSFEFSYTPDFTVSSTLGEPPPTAPWVKLLQVDIADAKTGQRVFHLHIGEPPQKGSEIELDKRRGKTTKKQESVRATLVTENGHTVFTLPTEARDLLVGQDEILSESDDPNTLMEIFLRGLRMNILHGVGDIRLRDGSSVSMPNLDVFLPYFTSDTLLPFRRKIQDIICRHETLSTSNLHLLQREVALCLTLDPYLTVQAFRDTGIGQLVPGLRAVTLEQWEQILRSRHMVVSTGALQRTERTAETMLAERQYYLGAVRSESGESYGGLEMFMNALEEQGISTSHAAVTPWERFVDLWRYEAEKPPRFLANSVNLKDFAHGTWLGDDLERDSTREQAEYRVQNIHLLIEILSHYPSGLTPLDIEQLYNQWDADIPRVQNIKEIFCDLKLLGLVQLHTSRRIYKGRKFIGGISRYTLSPMQATNSIDSILETEDFHRFMRVEKYPDLPESEFGKIMVVNSLMVDTLLKTGKIRLLQAMESLQKKDIEVILARLYGLDPHQSNIIPTHKILNWMSMIKEYTRLCQEYIAARKGV